MQDSYSPGDGTAVAAHPWDIPDGEDVRAERLDSATLYRRHAEFVARFLLRMGAARGDVDDLLQETFLVAHRDGGYQPGPAKPSTYLAAIAYRVLHGARRKRRVRAFVQPDDERVARAASSGDPERTALQQERLRALHLALAELDEDKRVVFVLAEIQGEPVVSIAAALGIPVDTAYSRLKAGRRRFIEACARQGVGRPGGGP